MNRIETMTVANEDLAVIAEIVSDIIIGALLTIRLTHFQSRLEILYRDAQEWLGDEQVTLVMYIRAHAADLSPRQADLDPLTGEFARVVFADITVSDIKDMMVTNKNLSILDIAVALLVVGDAVNIYNNYLGSFTLIFTTFVGLTFLLDLILTAIFINNQSNISRQVLFRNSE